ncbi:MAG TPA: hypothetical protein DCM86_01865 [Verrucomicrobiales bacterium]|nr:hypothetical protein [Verrucomicrobiales bacterium]
MLLTAGLPASAADKTYQVTGTIVSVTDAAITVNKDNEKWTVARDKGTKLAGDLKPGTKVTIYYKMVATEVEVKEAKKK